MYTVIIYNKMNNEINRFERPTIQRVENTIRFFARSIQGRWARVENSEGFQVAYGDDIKIHWEK